MYCIVFYDIIYIIFSCSCNLRQKTYLIKDLDDLNIHSGCRQQTFLFYSVLSLNFVIFLISLLLVIHINEVFRWNFGFFSVLM